jgi:hypothetical protein
MGPIVKGTEARLGVGVDEGEPTEVGELMDGAVGTELDRVLFGARCGVVTCAEV